MAAIFGTGGPIILPWTVRGDRFSGGTVHGVTILPYVGLLCTLIAQFTVQHRRVGRLCM